MYLTVIQKNPTYLEISFIHKNTIYAYYLLADLGLFGDTSADRKTIEEKLSINNKPIFIRNFHLEVFIPRFLKNDFKPESAKLTELTIKRLDPQKLFLINVFKTYYSEIKAQNILEWFDTYLNVSLSCNLISLNEKHLDLAVLNKMLQEFGIKGNTISISKDSKGSIGLF